MDVMSLSARGRQKPSFDRFDWVKTEITKYVQKKIRFIALRLHPDKCSEFDGTDVPNNEALQFMNKGTN